MEFIIFLGGILVSTLLLCFLIPLMVIDKNFINRELKRYISASKKLSDKSGFIEATKYEFDKGERVIQTGLMAIFAGFIAVKINGVALLLPYILIGYFLILLFVFYIRLGKAHSEIISALYREKN